MAVKHHAAPAECSFSVVEVSRLEWLSVLSAPHLGLVLGA